MIDNTVLINENSDDDISVLSTKNDKKNDSVRKYKLCQFWLENGWCLYNNNCINAHGTRDINICASTLDDQRENYNNAVKQAFEKAGAGSIKEGKGKGKNKGDGKGKNKGEGKGKSKNKDNNEENSTEKYKTVLCKYFLEGNCRFESDKCKFAHGDNELKV